MIQIAIMGLGTVGTGVAKVVAENARQIERKLGEPLQVKTILVRHFKDGPYRQLMTDDFTKIEEDHAIRVVVETIGGVEAAYEYTKRALNAGKHVVTANKQLVAEKGAELLALAKKRGVNYLFEASVGGGIPVLHPLTQCMAANRIDEVYGILNGTTNYILTRMVRAGTTFADALKEAQEKGYAEADPTADVEGVDAGRKICILADLAFGCQVDPADVPMEGISRLSLRDVKIAQRAGYRVKLLGRAVRLPGGRTAYVAPHLIPEEQPLASVDDVFNAVVVRGNATGEVMFYIYESEIYDRTIGNKGSEDYQFLTPLEVDSPGLAEDGLSWCWDGDPVQQELVDTLPAELHFGVRSIAGTASVRQESADRHNEAMELLTRFIEKRPVADETTDE